MATRKPSTRPAPESDGGQTSAALPSPFPPIAEYAFLSDCHTGSLIAPDGAVDWLCVPRFDSPSVFGSLLDRASGVFRFGPFGINVPTARNYEPGTNVLVTTWKTPSGWVIVRDALIMGPSTGHDTVTPHTRPPADHDAEHMLVRVAECVGRRVEMEVVCEPVFDYGRAPATWSIVDGRGPCRRSDRRRRHACGSTPIFASAWKAIACGAVTSWSPVIASSARCRGRRISRDLLTPPTPIGASRRRSSSGDSGWMGRASRIIAIETRSNGPHSPSRD